MLGSTGTHMSDFMNLSFNSGVGPWRSSSILYATNSASDWPSVVALVSVLTLMVCKGGYTYVPDESHVLIWN